MKTGSEKIGEALEWFAKMTLLIVLLKTKHEAKRYQCGWLEKVHTEQSKKHSFLFFIL